MQFWERLQGLEEEGVAVVDICWEKTSQVQRVGGVGGDVDNVGAQRWEKEERGPRTANSARQPSKLVGLVASPANPRHERQVQHSG